MTDPAPDLEPLRRILAEGPTPLFATLSGAHLYGFASADSDLDLRGAFVAPLRDVLGLGEPRETLTVRRTEGGVELDWVAHDVHKFCRLMTQRNGYVLEQLYSPRVVHGGPWLDELRELGTGCIVRLLYHHYRGFAHGQRRELAEKKPTLKGLLYAFRVYLSGLHLLRTGRLEAHLPTLLAEHPVPGVGELIERKRQGPETSLLDDGELASWTPHLDALSGELDDAFAASQLPDAPAGLDRLSDFVVRARLELGDG